MRVSVLPGEPAWTSKQIHSCCCFQVCLILGIEGANPLGGASELETVMPSILFIKVIVACLVAKQLPVTKAVAVPEA